MSKTERNNKPKRKELKYELTEDGAEELVNTDNDYYIACCDCGLVHRNKYKVIDGKTISVRAWRNDRETNRVRKTYPKNK